MKRKTSVTENNAVRSFQLKKIVVSFALLFIITLNARSAEDPGVSEAVQASFEKEFSGAQLIGWKDMGEFMKATFILGERRTEAYFRENGELEGSVRSLFYSQLPLVVMTSFDKRFGGAEVWDVLEINNSQGTTCRITLEQKHKKYRVRMDANGNIKDIERLKK
jgi:hypothetical protein